MESQSEVLPVNLALFTQSKLGLRYTRCLGRVFYLQRLPFGKIGLFLSCTRIKTLILSLKGGITRLEHCYTDGIFMSFQQLKENYQLPDKDFSKYLQLRNFLRNLQKQWKLPKMSPIEFRFHDGQPMVRTF